MPAPNPVEVEIPCEKFLGLNTEVAPPDLPEGVSPSCQDVAFVPGTVFSRPGLKRIFPQPFPGGVTATYQKTYRQPTEDPLNLYMTSDGNLWYEDILNAPDAYTKLATIIAGLYAQSVTANGTEYIAFSDGLHGADIPRQVFTTPDGTLQFDRVSQDGPGAAPTVQNAVPPSATIKNSGSGVGVAVSTITPSDQKTFQIPKSGFSGPRNVRLGDVGFSGGSGNPPIIYFTTLTVVTSAAHGLTTGKYVSVTGNSLYNFAAQPVTVINGTTFKVTISSASGDVGNGGTATPLNPSLSRTANVVTGTTSGAHGFQVGWQVQVTGIADTTIGGGIAAIARDVNGIVTVTTTSAHGLVAGATINITGVTNPDATFNTPAPVSVSAVLNPTQFQYQQGGAVEASNAGSGNVKDVWNATAFIQSVPTPTTFTYDNLGPDDQTSATGTATILGQISAGIHQLAVSFLTRSGYLTKPSPPVTFTANGQQQLLVENIPLGPANVIARVLEFTGAGGAFFYYLPITPVANGQIVGSSTTITDNTTTSLIVDFSDTTLYGGISISQTGNNLFSQVVLGPALGVFFFASRLFWWGMRNKVQNLLNMGFEGGTFSGAANTPLGWTVATAGGALVPGESGFGSAWQVTGDGSANRKGMITQPCFQDAFQVPIVQPNTLYNFRLYASNTNGNSGLILIEFYSPSQGILAAATINAANIPAPGFYEATFSAPTPALIPSDLVLRVCDLNTANAQVIVHDEFELIPTYDPFADSTFAVSYANNLEAYDGVTGVLGPASDPNPLKGCETIRDNLQFLTSGGMHSTSDNGQEPDTWTVDEISNDTGLVSSRAIDAGEESIIFLSRSGSRYSLRIFESGQPWKISQEIQSLFDNINPAAEQSSWLVNDTGERRIYIGVPVGTATAPNQIYALDYREIDTAYQIATSPSIHISFTGKMIASDLGRKWCPWNISANCGAILARENNGMAMCFGGGNGVAPGGLAGFGNFYQLDSTKKSDDDYGAIAPFYVLYFFINHDVEQAAGVGSMRKLYKGASFFISGTGHIALTPYADSLSNPWPTKTGWTGSQSPTKDLYVGLGVSAERMAVKFSVSPLAGTTDASFSLQKMVARIQQHPWSPAGAGATL